MLGLWILFACLVLVLLWLDLFVFHRHDHDIGTREALGWSVFWIALGLAFSGAIYAVYEHELFGARLPETSDVFVHSPGGEAVVLYLTGYLLEKSLSVDNLFVISLIFAGLQIDPRYQHRVLFWGIIGALVMRFVMITGGIWLVTRFSWMFYVFGGVLVLSGIKMLWTTEQAEDVSSVWWMRGIRRVLPLTQADGGRFVVRKGAGRAFTPLALALLAVETADLIFAVDSVPAILSVTTESFIVVTSNVFAILGLRSLYFVLANMIRRFRYLEFALSLLLVVIGAKMLLHGVVDIPNMYSLFMVLGIVGAGITASLMVERGERLAAERVVAGEGEET